MNKRILVANWKSNPKSLREAVQMARAIDRASMFRRTVGVVVAPPFPFLAGVGRVLERAHLGAQDSFWAGGAYTGAVSPDELKSLGVQYVILGHSERRIHAGETDDMIGKKILAVLEAGMSPILCVGERERAGRDIPAIVGEQIMAALRGIPPAYAPRVIIVYEPVWAISTMPGAVADTPESAFRARAYIRRIINDLWGRALSESLRVLYGGSVTPENIGSFMRDSEMDGALVGGASLNPTLFGEIIRIAASVKRP